MTEGAAVLSFGTIPDQLVMEMIDVRVDTFSELTSGPDIHMRGGYQFFFGNGWLLEVWPDPLASATHEPDRPWRTIEDAAEATVVLWDANERRQKWDNGLDLRRQPPASVLSLIRIVAREGSNP